MKQNPLHLQQNIGGNWQTPDLARTARLLIVGHEERPPHLMDDTSIWAVSRERRLGEHRTDI